MSIFNVLYQSYLQAEERGQVDNLDLDESQRNIAILPIFHHNIRSNGSNVLEIVLDAEGKASQIQIIPKDVYVIFPITEESLNRTSGARAHPICDDMQYLSSSLAPTKYKNYCETNDAWTEAMIQELKALAAGAHEDLIHFIMDIQDLIRNYDILEVTRELLQKSYFCEVTANANIIKIELPSSDGKEKAKYKTLDLSKAFITFRKHFADPQKKDLDISRSKALHETHIKYIQGLKAQNAKALDFCDVSGLQAYCTNTCRGIMGKSKIISVSNNTEAYKGRLRQKEDVYRIGAETSEKIFLMLKFFLEHKENSQYLYDNTTAVIWFAKDLLNERAFDVSNPVATDDDLFSFWDQSAEANKTDDEGYVTQSLSNPATARWKKLLMGQESLSQTDEEDFFYLMIINKIVPGRMSIQAAKTIPLTIFVDNLRKWRNSCFWPRWNGKARAYQNETPKTWEMIYMIYGIEEDGQIELRNEKLKALAFKRLLPTILDGRPLPADFARRMFTNFTKRVSYPKTWARVVNMTCALVNKRRRDQGLEGRSSMLEKDKQTRDYLYGRLLAICEKIEVDAMTSQSDKKVTSDKKSASDKNTESIRVTNVERLWSAFFQAPEKTFNILDKKLQPYFRKLKSDKPGLYVNHQKFLVEVLTAIREDMAYEANKNLALGEDTVFGYYAQKQDFYTKKTKEEEN